MDYAFLYAEQSGVAKESDYPYTAQQGTCELSAVTDLALKSGDVKGYHDVDQDAAALKSALMQQPVSVAIEADQNIFQQYSSGVIDNGCGSQLDHGVLAVGYEGDEYFIVKNSWGSTWGQDGYVNIAPDQCGITLQASYPTVGSAISLII